MKHIISHKIFWSLLENEVGWSEVELCCIEWDIHWLLSGWLSQRDYHDPETLQQVISNSFVDELLTLYTCYVLPIFIDM